MSSQYTATDSPSLRIHRDCLNPANKFPKKGYLSEPTLDELKWAFPVGKRWSVVKL
jgi:hypothetical protein